MKTRRTSNNKGLNTSDKKPARESLHRDNKEKRGSSVVQEQAVQRDVLIQKYIQLLSDPEPEKPIETRITVTDKTNDRWIIAASRGPSSNDSDDIRLQLVVTKVKPGASEAAESEDDPEPGPVQKPPSSRDNTPSRTRAHRSDALWSFDPIPKRPMYSESERMAGSRSEAGRQEDYRVIRINRSYSRVGGMAGSESSPNDRMFDVTPENSVSGDGATTAHERGIQVLMNVAYREQDVPVIEPSETEKECAKDVGDFEDFLFNMLVEQRGLTPSLLKKPKLDL